MKKLSSKNLKIVVSVSLFALLLVLLLKGGPSDIDDKFKEFITKKDIAGVLVGTIVSNIFSDNITTISEGLILPMLSNVLKVDLTKPIEYKGYKFETNKLISNFIKLLLTVFVVLIVFYRA